MRDGADGRFVPGLRVTATLIDAYGEELGTHEHPSCGTRCSTTTGATGRPRATASTPFAIQIDPPQFMRHDEINGRRFTECVGVEFTGVRAKTGHG